MKKTTVALQNVKFLKWQNKLSKTEQECKSLNSMWFLTDH
jgi:hypothetical protein